MNKSIDTFLLLESYFIAGRLDQGIALLSVLDDEKADGMIAQHIQEVEQIYGEKLTIDVSRFKKIMDSQEVRRRFEACQNRTEAQYDHFS